MRFLNWPHAILGFLIGLALVLYIRGGHEENDISVQNATEVVEVQTE